MSMLHAARPFHTSRDSPKGQWTRELIETERKINEHRGALEILHKRAEILRAKIANIS